MITLEGENSRIMQNEYDLLMAECNELFKLKNNIRINN